MSSDTAQDLEVPAVCIRCFGRSFAKVGTGISNTERGESFYPENEQSFYNAGFRLSDEASCSICHGVFLRLEDYYEVLMEEIGDIEYSTFLVGSKFPGKSLETEEKLQVLFGNNGEPVKREFNREFGKYVSERIHKEAEFKEPDITVVVDLTYDSFKIKPRNLFIYGIYRKNRRDIPQTRWIHKKDIDASIETIVGDKLNELTR